MSYIEKNKEAWEEAFDNRINGWGDAVVENLQASSAYYIQPSLQAELGGCSRNKWNPETTSNRK